MTPPDAMIRVSPTREPCSRLTQRVRYQSTGDPPPRPAPVWEHLVWPYSIIARTFTVPGARALLSLALRCTESEFDNLTWEGLLVNNLPCFPGSISVYTAIEVFQHLAPNEITSADDEIAVLDWLLDSPTARVITQDRWVAYTSGFRAETELRGGVPLPQFFIRPDGAAGIPLHVALDATDETLKEFSRPFVTGHSSIKVRIGVRVFSGS